MSSVNKMRQSQTRQHSPDPALFFSQVTLSCSELPEGDKDAIIAGVLAMGGLYSSPLTKLVTHIVTLSTDNDKCTLAKQKMPHCRIVLPHWFDDCFRLGKLIDETPYLFPDPEILRLEHAEPVRIRQTPDIEGATSAVAGKVPVYRPPQSPSQSRQQLSVLKDKRILFSRDLNVNDHLSKSLQALVEQAGGQMTTSVTDCDIYIGHFRDGEDYVEASQTGKEVANLSWFYNVINRNRWTNPLTKLLHYPVPREGISGFNDLRISLSNYTGEARIYLENLVKQSGAGFTKTMKQDNTHLITAHMQSDKVDAAQEWNINIINHLWLEESYAKCQMQTTTCPRYTHFPPRTNLTEIVGQTPINLEAVRKCYFAAKEKTIKDLEMDMKPTSGPTPVPYRGAVLPHRSPRKSVPASSANGTRLASSALNTSMDTGDDGTPAPPETTRKPKARKVSDAETPAHRRLEGKENETPSTTGRSAKNRALDMLHQQKDDIALFERQMKRKGGVVHGGRKTLDDVDIAPSSAKKGVRSRKRASGEDLDTDSEMMDGDAEDVVKPVGRQVKKTKKGERDGSADRLPPVQYKMLVTGDARWQGHAKKEEADAVSHLLCFLIPNTEPKLTPHSQRKLRSLGVELVQDPLDCTILCAPSIKRTEKFVCALAAAPAVVNSSYLDHLLKSPSTPQTPEEHWLVDRDFEEKWGLRLDEALVRAKENRRRLFKGWTVFFTDKVSGGYETWRRIITSNGGTATLYRGRTGLSLPKTRTLPSEDPEAVNQGPDADADVDVVYLVSGTDDEEVKLWKTFRTQCEKQGMRGRIAQTDWVLHCAMSQRIQWDGKWEHREELVPGFRIKYGR